MDEKIKRHIKLSWWLLEQKCIYYFTDLCHKSWADSMVDDSVYDAREREYKNLCTKLGLEPTVVDMVGFEINRPCCQEVLKKLGKKKKHPLVGRIDL